MASLNVEVHHEKRMRKKWIVICSVLIWIASFGWESQIFDVQMRYIRFGDYLICRGIALAFIFLSCRFIAKLIEKQWNSEKQILLYGLPYAFVLGIFWRILGIYPLAGDELWIYENATQYDPTRFFTCYTGYFYIVSLMLIPTMSSIVIMKMILQTLAAGYFIYRAKRILKKKCFVLLYMVFLLWPVLQLAMSVHRMPIYAVCYFFVITKLIADYYEHKKYDFKDILAVMILLSILSWWRTEGIYLTVLGIPMIIIAYRLPKKRYAKIIALYILCQIIMMLLQMLPTQFADSSYASNRMAPFYDYTLKTMIDSGLEVDEASSEWMAVQGYWETEENYEAYVKAAQKMIIQNPVYFVKARINSWNDISFGMLDQTRYPRISVIDNIKQFLYMIMYNLYIPLISLIIVVCYSLYKKRWLVFWCSSCGLIHAGICFLLMPGALFKYFYIMYLMGWISIIFFVCFKINSRTKSLYT